MAKARSFSDEILNRFAASPLPEARLVVIQALWERHIEADELPPLLEKLRHDSSKVVSVITENLIARLTDPEKAEKMRKAQASETAHLGGKMGLKGFFKGKGKGFSDSDEDA